MIELPWAFTITFLVAVGAFIFSVGHHLGVISTKRMMEHIYGNTWQSDLKTWREQMR